MEGDVFLAALYGRIDCDISEQPSCSITYKFLIHISGKIITVPRLIQNTYSKTKTNIRLSDYECTHIMGVMLVLLNITCYLLVLFKNEIYGLLG